MSKKEIEIYYIESHKRTKYNKRYDPHITMIDQGENE